MHFLTDEQMQFKNELRRFVDAEMRPAAAELDRSAAYPAALFARLGQLGYLDAAFLSDSSETRYNALEGTIIIEEVSRGLASLGLIISPQFQCCDVISMVGSDALKREVLAPARRGEALLAFALTEASGGSDALGIDTTALRSGDHWVLNGTKCWITSAGVADGYIVGARTSAFGRSRSVSLFYVPASAPGLHVFERKQMMGMRSSPMGMIAFEDCVIPADYILGAENDAYRLIKPMLNEGRLDMAAIAVGIGQAALEASVHYTSSIGQYGRSLSSYQSISFSVADMFTKITTSRNSLYHVASLFDAHRPCSTEAAALKLFATESCCEVCNAARQIHGASGLSQPSEVERLFRDSQMLTTAEGTSEICKIVISNAMYSHRPENY